MFCLRTVTSLPPLSLYIHLPWCVRKCPYCDFNSHQAGDDIDESAYIEALQRDLDTELPFVAGRSLQSIFIGGGTPSLFSAAGIADILDNCRRHIAFDETIEVTMEANPGTFEQQKFEGFRQAGVNRLSIGIQSFHADHLRSLGRIHDDREAHRAVDIAQQAGFDNINLDLMFALPAQTTGQAVNDVQTACAKQVQHISHYQLTIEPNTYFHKHPPARPDDDAMWEMQQACQTVLAQHGYRQYEVSAWAQAGKRSRHNLNYWQFGDYIGIGAGAHGKLTHEQGVTRRWKKRQPADYMKSAAQGEALSGCQRISEDELVFEFMLNALRLCEGVPTSLFCERTGLSLTQLQARCREIDPTVLLIDDQVVRATDLGYRYIDEILQKLL